MANFAVKRKSAAFPTTNVDADSLYFKYDSSSMEMRMGKNTSSLLMMRNDLYCATASAVDSNGVITASIDAFIDYFTNFKIMLDISSIKATIIGEGFATLSLNINSKGEKAIYNTQGTTANYLELVGNNWILLVYDGQRFNLVCTAMDIDTYISERYLPLTGGTMSGNISMSNEKIISLGDPVNGTDAANKNYVDTSLGNYLPLAGGTMSGAISMGRSKITDMSEPTDDRDAATKYYVDNHSGSGSSWSVGCDTRVDTIDGKKDAQVAYGQRGVSTIGLDLDIVMDVSTCIHIFAIGENNKQASQGYNLVINKFFSGGRTGNASASTAQTNHTTWINGVICNTDQSFTIPASGMLEISIMYTSFTDAEQGITKYRTIIKVG